MNLRALRPTLAGLCLLLPACTPRAAAIAPPDIAYGRDLCDECGMLIDDPRFAAATIVEGGDPHRFDDLGEMLTYHAGHPEEVVRAWFVHDYDSQVWLRGEGAFYVVSPEVHSPMGFGIVAFEDRSRAEAFSAPLGVAVLTFEELRAGAMHMPGPGTH